MISLRNLQIDDSQLFAKLANDPRIFQNTSDRFPHPYNTEDAIKFIEQHCLKSDSSVFGIQYKNELVGGIGLHFREDIYRKTAELGYWISPDFWGKGIASDSIRQILELGFENFDLQVVVAHVFGRNKVSQRVLIKNAFTLLGTIPNGAFKLNTYEDDVVFFKSNPNRP